MRVPWIAFGALLLTTLAGAVPVPAPTPDPLPDPVATTRQAQDSLDARVQRFLEAHRWSARDMNIPAIDGQVLHDIVLEHGFTRALEIGTSTGHSATWIAWAVSKTGGRLITVEIDEPRYREALQNFEEAGLSGYIDARLADAHELVPRLDGPFDFVFIDADKDWYTRYLHAIYPKLAPGGCIAAHNVTGGRGGWVDDYLTALDTMPALETRLLRESRSGLTVSCLTTGA